VSDLVKKAINRLIEEMEKKSAKEDIEIVQSFVQDCSKYVDAVVNMENAITVSRFILEPDAYREHLVNLDKSRKIAHDSLIVSVKLVNKLCRLYDVDPIYKGSDSRIEVAEFAKQVVDEFFAERKAAR